MTMRKCPQCDLNYIKDTEEACEICAPKPREGYTINAKGREVKLPKPIAEGNIAFKCNYCDGGGAETQIGYAGVCSEKNIAENIKIKKRTWCCDKECRCFLYIHNKMKYDELIADGTLCYESRLLLDWKASAGEDRKDGERRGRHRKLSKNVSGGLCVLTTITSEMQEENERLIFGVFICDKFEEGEDGEASGFVQCTTDYKIKLAPDEAKQMLFWNYYSNQTDKETASWASGLFRYIDDYQSAQILRDIASIKIGTADDTLANELFKKYCESKGIDITTIPPNDGALIKQPK